MAIHVGDTVLVFLPDDNSLSEKMMSYDGTKQTVSRLLRGSSPKNTICELEGVLTDAGIPYSFLCDWLVQVDPE